MKSILLLTLILTNVGLNNLPTRTNVSTCHLDIILSMYKKIQEFEEKLFLEQKIQYEDSIFHTNKRLIQFIYQYDFYALNDSVISKINSATDIRITTSQEKEVVCISWAVFKNYPIPLYSRVLFGEKAKRILSQNGTDESDFGENLDVGKIVLSKTNDQQVCILLGSNRCGSICVREVAQAYDIQNNFEDICCFLEEGKKYSSIVEFDYVLNDQLKISPMFNVFGNLLFMPLFNLNKTKVVGKKKILITPNKCVG